MFDRFVIFTRRPVISALVAGCVGLACLAAGAAELTTIRAESQPDLTRLVFELSSATRKDVFLIPNPDRIVVDLNDTRASRELALPPGATGTVRRLRYAPHGNGLRLILDLGRRVKARDEMLGPDGAGGNRLVLTLAHGSAASPGIAGTAAFSRRPRAGAPASTLSEPVTAITGAVLPAASSVDVAMAPAALKRMKPVRGGSGRGRPVLVAIDAGHGGEDVGAIGASGTYEKDITLLVARELAAMIDKQSGMKAMLTRDDDYYVGLRERMDKAREAKADLFVSIHADAFRDRRVQGSSVFVLSQRGASSEAARWLAERENSADLVGGVSLDDKDHVVKSVLLDLSQSASLEASMQVANEVLRSLGRIGAVHHAEVQQAGFMVLKSPDIPSLLVETAFITNPREEEHLRNGKFRRQLAAAVRDGIIGYFSEAAPPGSQFAENR